MDKFLQERQRGVPTSGLVLKEKALDIYRKKIKRMRICASNRWLTQCNKRHGIHFAHVSEEKICKTMQIFLNMLHSTFFYNTK